MKGADQNKEKNDIFDGPLTGRAYAGFVWPSILMIMVMSLYYIIDSIFVANLVGAEGLAAMNIAYPVQGLMWGFAVMLAAGSSALAAIVMGEGRQREANEKFTFISIFSVAMGLLITLAILLCLDSVTWILGATEQLTEDCRIFLGVYAWGCPAALTGVIFEYFIRVDGSPGFTVLLYISGGLVHLGLDILLMGPLHMGLRGAAIANACGLYATALMGLIYFLRRGSRLHFNACQPDWAYAWKSFVNGSPEFINESAAGIVTFFCNMVVIRLAGETGVAAVAVVLNIHYFFMSIHIGYQSGCLPLISYYYGAKRYEKIDQIMRYTRYFILVVSIVTFLMTLLGAPVLTLVYAEPGTLLYTLSVQGLRIASISLLAVGINVFASGFFTCFGRGLISSVIALSRGLVMLLIGLFVLSYFFGLAGGWAAIPFADVTTLILSFALLAAGRKRYHYRILG